MNHNTLRVTAAAALACASVAAQAASLELYEQAGYKGTMLGLSSAVANLGDYGFNDRAVSLIVRSGSWEICADVNFANACTTYGPGSHDNLPFALARHISSVRPAGSGSSGYGGYGHGQAAVALFADAGFSGRRVDVNQAMPDLGAAQFNDSMSSFEIYAGQWQLCDDVNYGGRCDVVGPGRYDIWDKANDRLSSLRPLDSGASQNNQNGWAAVTLYRDARFGGSAVSVNGPVDNLGSMQFNDEASSIVVSNGQWQFCSDSGFRGRCITLGPGRHDVSTTLNDTISSVRPVSGQVGRPGTIRR